MREWSRIGETRGGLLGFFAEEANFLLVYVITVYVKNIRD